MNRYDIRLLEEALFWLRQPCIEVDYDSDRRAAAPELWPESDLWYGYLFKSEDHPVEWHFLFERAIRSQRAEHLQWQLRFRRAHVLSPPRNDSSRMV